VSTQAAPRFWRDNLLLDGGALVAGVANALYHVIVARMLGPLQYGVLAALGTIVLLLELPVSMIALVYTRRGATPDRLARLNGIWAGWGVLVWVGVWATAPWLGRLFGLPPRLVWLFGLAVIPTYAYGLNLGVMQWAAQFFWAGALVAWDAVARALAALVALAGQLGLMGLVVAAPLVTLSDGLFSWMAARGSVRQASREGLASFGGLPNAAVVGALTLVMTSADVLAAKHALSPRAAGFYGGLATLGRAPVYFAGAVGTVLLSSAQRQPTHGWRYLQYSLAVMAALDAAGAGLYALAGRFLITAALGVRFMPMARWLVPYTLAMGLEGLLLVTLYYGAARGRWTVTAVAATVFAVWMAVLWTTHELGVVVDDTVAVMMAGFLAAGGTAVWIHLRSRPPAVNKKGQPASAGWPRAGQ